MCTINIMEPLELTYLDRFLTELARQDLAAHTRLNYRLDLQHFAGWFHGSTSEAFSPDGVTPTDLREYRSFLINVQRRAPATVNRRLAALRKFFRWARAEGLVREDPTTAVREVELVRTAPKSLDKRQADKILREAQNDGSKRNVAILQVLRHTGLRVAELCALRLDDVELGERSGRVLVRSGKGSKHVRCRSIMRRARRSRRISRCGRRPRRTPCLWANGARPCSRGRYRRLSGS